MLRPTVTNYHAARALVLRVASVVRSSPVWPALRLLVAAGCGASPAGLSDREASTEVVRCPQEETTAGPSFDPDDPGFRDVEWYAEAQGIPIEEAVRRLELQQNPALNRLQPELTAKERDTFAGLWIQHKPDYRYVVLFTEGGEETIQPYLQCNPHADVVEVRNGADATLAELIAAEEEAARIVDSLGIPTDSGIYVSKNRAEVLVTDWAALEAALQDAGERLPEHVVVVEVEELSSPM